MEFCFSEYMINIKRTEWDVFFVYRLRDLVLLIIHPLLWYFILLDVLQVNPQGPMPWRHRKFVSAAWMLLVLLLHICNGTCLEEKWDLKKENMLGFSPWVSVRTAVRSFFTPVWRKGLGFSLSLDLDLAEGTSPGKKWVFPFLRVKKALKDKCYSFKSSDMSQTIQTNKENWWARSSPALERC